MKALLFFLALIPAGSVAASGPAGLEQGMKLEEIRKLITVIKVKPYTYRTENVPSGHAEFDDYLLVITPRHGLCKVVAWASDISSSVYGDDVKRKFDALLDAVTVKYGTSEKYDFLRPGSIWDGPQDWMMSLAKEERKLAAFWSHGESSTLPATINSIKLQAHGLNSTSAMIELHYEFQIHSECIKWIKSQQNSSL